MVDAHICAYDVRAGRPAPYMVHRLMEKCNIMTAKHVAKAGDSRADIGEGRNAGCGLVAGVLSGADSAEAFVGADIIVGDVTDIPLECYKVGGEHTRAILQMASQGGLWLPESAPKTILSSQISPQQLTSRSSHSSRISNGQKKQVQGSGVHKITINMTN